MQVAGWIVAGAALAGTAGAAERRSASRELVVAGDGTMPTSVAGVPARLRVAPDAPGLPMLDAGLAARARLKAGPFAVAYGIGPVRVSGSTAVARIALGRAPEKRRVAWPDRDFVAGADAVVGPGGVPHPIVRFQLRAPRPGERVAALPMVDGGGLFGGWSGLFALAPVGGVPTRVRFNIDNPRTLANAGAGLALGHAHGGRLEGGPGPAHIAFGISRPVRRMRLARPLTVGPLLVGEVHVRVADGRGAAGLPEAGAAVDPDEVVVTAKSKRDRRNDAITLGRDQLDRCSSITFDKPAKQVRLSCL